MAKIMTQEKNNFMMVVLALTIIVLYHLSEQFSDTIIGNCHLFVQGLTI